MIVSLSGWVVTALATAFAAAPVWASQQAPDLVLLGGTVFTSDTARPWAEAVAIRGGRIVAVGTTADIRRLAGPSSRVIDVGGRVVVPGFNDAHDHILAGSPGTNVWMGGPALDAAGDQVLDSVRAATGRVARGTWIRVEIWAKAFDDTTLRRTAACAACSPVRFSGASSLRSTRWATARWRSSLGSWRPSHPIRYGDRCAFASSTAGSLARPICGPGRLPGAW